MTAGIEVGMSTSGGAIKTVGKSGQISLGKRYAGRTLELQQLEDGTLLLRAVTMVPDSQLWTLHEPERSRIARGLAWAAEAPPRASDLRGLVSQARKRRSSARARGK
jgi:hypothetical protein